MYEILTNAITNWAEKAHLFLADHTPGDLVLTTAMDEESAEPVGPRGTLHCLVSVLSMYDSYNGLIPPIVGPQWAFLRESREEADS